MSKKQPIRVLSLFDGMSCMQIALKEIGYPVDNYYASEIDKHAIAQTQYNFPDTIQLGDVTKWREWDIDWSTIDLIGAGSPCQGFSFAGKQLAFNDPRSKLFFVFVDILNHITKYNPKIKFLLENVRMKAEHEAVITQYTGVNPIYINSALVSAQNRERIYWCNIGMVQSGLFGEWYPGIPQPEDRGILLRDILETEVAEKYYLKSDKIKEFVTDNWRLDKRYTQINGEKGLPLLARVYSSWCGDYVQKDNLVITHNLQPRQGKGIGGKGHLQKYDQKSYCADTSNSQAVEYNYRIRRLTPTECARLQTIPDWYKWKCSDTRAYAMLGNGWTVEVIKHILKYLTI